MLPLRSVGRSNFVRVYVNLTTVDNYEERIEHYIYIYLFICHSSLYLNLFVSLYLYVPDEGSLLPKYRDCTTYNDFELYLMCCGVMLLLLIIYIYRYIYA